MSPEVITLGEAMVLLLAEQHGSLGDALTFRRYVAGAECNVAVGLCRLGHTAAWLGRVGDDEWGRAVLRRLRGEGVDVSRVVTDAEAPTGVYFRERRELGPINVMYYRRGSAASRLCPADLDAEDIRSTRYLHLTGITPALSDSCRRAVFAAAEMAREGGAMVTLDPNFRSKLWSADEARRTLRDLAGRCDVLLPGTDELELLTGGSDPVQAAYRLLELGPQQVVVKLGSQGAVAVDTEGGVTFSPAVPLPRVVDPVGAGDAFAAGFIASKLRGLGVAAALAVANRCGARATSMPGDSESLPLWEEVADAHGTTEILR